VGTLGGQSRSPVKESSYLARTASVDEAEADGAHEKMEQSATKDGAAGMIADEMSVSPPPMKEGLPIRR
jgi:hypothetical protein